MNVLKIECSHFENGICKLASQHAEKEVRTTKEACNKCRKQMCNVPASLALASIGTPIPEPKKYLLQYIVKTYRILLTEGVGTEFSKLIKLLTPIVKWLYPLANIDQACTSCNQLKYRMNDWTITELNNNLDLILFELRARAIEQHVPYSRVLYKGLLHVAIWKHKRNVRKSFRNQSGQESRTNGTCSRRI